MVGFALKENQDKAYENFYRRVYLREILMSMGFPECFLEYCWNQNKTEITFSEIITYFREYVRDGVLNGFGRDKKNKPIEPIDLMRPQLESSYYSILSRKINELIDKVNSLSKE